MRMSSGTRWFAMLLATSLGIVLAVAGYHAHGIPLLSDVTSVDVERSTAGGSPICPACSLAPNPFPPAISLIDFLPPEHGLGRDLAPAPETVALVGRLPGSPRAPPLT